MARNEGRDDTPLIGLMLVLGGLVIVLGHGWFNSWSGREALQRQYERLERDFNSYQHGVKDSR